MTAERRGIRERLLWWLADKAERAAYRLTERRRGNIGSARRRIREAAGATLRDVATELGVSHQTVANWERGGDPRKHRAAYEQLLVELQQVTDESTA